VINEYQIKDDDVIIKCTGRYKIMENSFFEMINNDNEKYDAFVKFFNVCTLQYIHDDCVLGLYAIKCKFLKHFNYQKIKSPECEFANFVRESIEREKINEIGMLGLLCCFADDFRTLIV
jgi:hypothetical protein